MIPMKEWKNYNLNWVLMPTTGNTVVASPRGLIAVIENNYQSDGTVLIPEALQPYMGGLKEIKIKK